MEWRFGRGTRAEKISLQDFENEMRVVQSTLVGRGGNISGNEVCPVG
jgi:hypothetical protein